VNRFVRTISLAILLSLVAGPCLGQQLVITPRNADGLYKAGEAANWTITRGPQATATTATYTIRKNGVMPPIKEGSLDLSSGSATIQMALDEPGALTLEVRPPAPAGAATAPAATSAPRGRGSGRGPGAAGRLIDGAVVAADQIKPSLPRPDDFDSWWASKLQELSMIPVNPKLEKTEVNVADIDYYKITMDNIGATHIQGQLARPTREGKFPAILQLQYAGVYPLQRQWVTDRAKAGWLALNVLAHDMPIDDAAAIQQMARGPLNNYQAIGNTDREKSYFLRMYLGDCRALQYLESRPDWDGKTLVVMGDSMGGQQSYATVGLVGEKVTHMIVHVPSGADVGAAGNGRAMAYPNWPNRPEVIQCARYFDQVNFAPRIKATTLVSVGLFDGTSPPTGVIAAFNLISGPKQLLPMHSDHQDANGNQAARMTRREEWLSALINGQPVPLR
jgi:cephalosporin-C deacetylase-like acetyl esterase